MAGRVIEVGSGVDVLKAGNRIAAVVPHKQYFKVRVQASYERPAGAFRKLPEEISPEEGCWMGDKMVAGVRAREYRTPH